MTRIPSDMFIQGISDDWHLEVSLLITNFNLEERNLVKIVYMPLIRKVGLYSSKVSELSILGIKARKMAVIALGKEKNRIH